MKAKYCLVVVIFLGSRLMYSQDIVDPVADFSAKYEGKSGDKIYRLVCDLENNGKPDIFLAYSSSLESDGDCGWVLYLNRNGKYITAPGLTEHGGTDSTLGITFNIKRYKIGNIAELDKWGLLTSETSTGVNNGTQLKAIIVEGNTFKMVDVGSYQLYTGPTPTPSPGSTPVPSRFPNPPVPAIEELNP